MSEKIDLKAIREKKGISLDEVFEATKISKRIVIAIEKGNVSNLFISDVYIKGFAKTYARYLGVNPEDVVEQIFAGKTPSQKKKVDLKNDTVDAGKNIEASAQKSNGNSLAGRVGAYFNLIKRGLSYSLRFVRDFLLWVVMLLISFVLKVPRKAWWAVAVAVLFAGIVLLWPRSSERNRMAKQPKEVKEEAKDSKAMVEKTIDSSDKALLKNSSVQGQASSHPENLGKNAAPIPQSAKFEILVRAVSNSWLRVKADGNEVFRSTLHKGDIETWKAKEEISMWVGNAGGIEVECGGKVYKDFGRKGRVIKDLVFYSDCSYEIRR